MADEHGDVSPFGRHVRRRFGPVEVDMLGDSGMIEFVGTGLRLLWDDGSRSDPLARQLAVLLRAGSGGALDRPERIRTPTRRRLTDPDPASPEVVRSLRVRRLGGEGSEGGERGVRVEVMTTVPGAEMVSVDVPAVPASMLADLLERWSGRASRPLGF